MHKLSSFGEIFSIASSNARDLATVLMMSGIALDGQKRSKHHNSPQKGIHKRRIERKRQKLARRAQRVN